MLFNFQQLSETLLKNRNFIDMVAEAINQTRSARETEVAKDVTAEGYQLTFEDMQNILSVTQNDPTFDEIVTDLVKTNWPNEGLAEVTPPDPLPPEMQPGCSKDIPLKERLRPRSEIKKTVTKRKEKVNIISNEPFTGVVPAIASRLISTAPAEPLPDMSPVLVSLPIYVQSPVEVLQTLQAVPTLTIPSISVESLVATTSYQQTVIQAEPTRLAVPTAVVTDDDKSKLQVEAKQATPKTVLYPSFLETKCKSTPRRSAKHVRTLDFDQTPSSRRISTIKEFHTPVSNGVPATTPGSAPANISLCKSSVRPSEPVALPDPVIDENSNSNSISNTPKVVVKQRRGKKFAAKLAEKPKVNVPPIDDELKKPFDLDDWNKMRSQNKNLPIDFQLRLANQSVENRNLRKRKTPKKCANKKGEEIAGEKEAQVEGRA